nr:copia protein [Tanacetum cinerariifolium]
MERLQFCDYHNMVAILEKSEHNIDFHPMVDFIKASPLMYALTVKPTVYVSHIRQFWSTARIETTEEGTQILATVDGIHRTVTESSLRRNLTLKDEEGINSLPDTKVFENLTLMGYNISPNQKFTFQTGQFSHQLKYLIHTIMQCINPKSTGFNEFSSNIATALVCLATNRTYNFSKMIFDGLVKNVNNKRGIVIKNKARLVAQGHTQEEGINYDEVFAHVARIEAIRPFLAYASFMGFTVYQMDVKSTFIYGTIDEEVYVM